MPAENGGHLMVHEEPQRQLEMVAVIDFLLDADLIEQGHIIRCQKTCGISDVAVGIRICDRDTGLVLAVGEKSAGLDDEPGVLGEIIIEA